MREELLTIDHEADDGAQHRKVLAGRNIMVWLRQNNFPAGFQVQCLNCNFAKGHGGCPHIKERASSSPALQASTMVQETGT